MRLGVNLGPVHLSGSTRGSRRKAAPLPPLRKGAGAVESGLYLLVAGIQLLVALAGLVFVLGILGVIVWSLLMS